MAVLRLFSVKIFSRYTQVYMVSQYVLQNRSLSVLLKDPMPRVRRMSFVLGRSMGTPIYLRARLFKWNPVLDRGIYKKDQRFIVRTFNRLLRGNAPEVLRMSYLILKMVMILSYFTRPLHGL